MQYLPANFKMSAVVHTMFSFNFDKQQSFFRWSSHDNGYRGVFDGCVWTLTQNDTHISYTVQGPLLEDKNYHDVLYKYFRLDVSLKDECQKWAAVDKHFKQTLDSTDGVRILHQDVVENLFSFICSSNNNIKRFVEICFNSRSTVAP